MNILAGIAGILLILIILWDAFETIVLPRQVSHRFRLTQTFYRATWRPWKACARFFKTPRRRGTYLGFFGPLSLPLLVGFWATGLIAGFGLIYWALGAAIEIHGFSSGLFTSFYLSGTTFFTLGLGDVVPHTILSRVLTVFEAGTGFGFLAIVIGYLPVIYQSFSRRELSISLLDARAGSPPTAGELLRRHPEAQGTEALRDLLKEWEYWAAELLESHLSYPVLCLFRSQHDNQSWISAICCILDTCALIMSGIEGTCTRQAELTFAIARHANVDLARIFHLQPLHGAKDRLPPRELQRLRTSLAEAGIILGAGPEVTKRLCDLRHMYEPYINALAAYLEFDVPAWRAPASVSDNWQTMAWGRNSTGGGATAVCMEGEPSSPAGENLNDESDTHF
jgi:hypothetical protein